VRDYKVQTVREDMLRVEVMKILELSIGDNKKPLAWLLENSYAPILKREYFSLIGKKQINPNRRQKRTKHS
jgi:hypothetical protein